MKSDLKCGNLELRISSADRLSLILRPCSAAPSSIPFNMHRVLQILSACFTSSPHASRHLSMLLHILSVAFDLLPLGMLLLHSACLIIPDAPSVSLHRSAATALVCLRCFFLALRLPSLPLLLRFTSRVSHLRSSFVFPVTR